jgi:DNA-binding GntR family transcriptional regulator
MLGAAAARLYAPEIAASVGVKPTVLRDALAQLREELRVD